MLDPKRELLFGLLACQNELISGSALISAAKNWANSNGKSLTGCLLEMGALSKQQCDLMDGLVTECLKVHAGNLDESLRKMGRADPFLKQALLNIHDASLTASIAVLKDPAPGLASTVAQISPAVQGGRYVILRPHAQGGLGHVSVALDQELHREVALKEIREDKSDDESCRLRFVLEAEITGGLEHPGIVPVYGLGHREDGRPYYAMRFIRGGDMKQAIASLHDGLHGGQPNMFELRKLLDRFLDVCQALHYAHSRGVLHRDVKPRNVMIGKYGETLIVDWGLAKAAGHSDVLPNVDETCLIPNSGSANQATMAGATVGTPSYMSPEQAHGRLDQLGPQTDVYSLGATLFELLTGRPPYSGESVAAVLEQVRAASPRRPREVCAWIPAALEAICLKAMRANPKERYASADLLAEDLQRWLADEPVTAHCEKLPARIARFGRKHRPLVTALASTLVLAVAALALTTILVSRQKQVAEGQKLRAEENLVLAQDAVDTMLVRVADHRLNEVPSMEVVRRDLLQSARDFQQRMLAQDQKSPALLLATLETHVRLATLDRRLGNTETAQAEMHRAEQLVESHSGMLSAVDVALARSKFLRFRMELGFDSGDLGKAKRIGTDIDLLWDGLPEHEPTAVELAERAVAAEQMGLIHRREQDFPRAIAEFEKSERLRSQLAQLQPESAEAQRHLAHAWQQLADVHLLVRDMAAAEPLLEKALRIANALPAPLDTDSKDLLAGVISDQATLYQATDRSHLAEQAFLKAIPTLQSLVQDYPRYRDYRVSLAIATFNAGNLAYLRLDFAQASKYYGQANQIVQGLLEQFPDNQEYQEFQLDILSNNASTLQYAGKFAEAESAFMQVLEHLKKTPPATAKDRRTLGMLHYNLGNLHYAWHPQESYELTEMHFQAAVEAFEVLYQANPKDRINTSDLASGLQNLAVILEETSRPTEALAKYERATTMLEKLFEQFPEGADIAHSLGLVHFNRGNLHSHLGARALAITAYQDSIAVLEKAHALQGDNPDENSARAALADTLNALAMLLADALAESDRAPEQALEYARRALDLAPNNGGIANTLGLCLFRNGQWAEAKEKFESSMALRNGGDSHDFYFLAMIAFHQGDPAEGQEWLSKADAWTAANAPSHQTLLRYQGEARALAPNQ